MSERAIPLELGLARVKGFCLRPLLSEELMPPNTRYDIQIGDSSGIRIYVLVQKYVDFVMMYSRKI